MVCGHKVVRLFSTGELPVTVCSIFYLEAIIAQVTVTEEVTRAILEKKRGAEYESND
jgi:hypothetical protein